MESKSVNGWPRLDPLTNRTICESCWNNKHRRKNKAGVLVDACDGECDCVHRSEETWAAIERQKNLSNRKAKKKLLKELLESEQNPLRAVNHNFKKGNPT